MAAVPPTVCYSYVRFSHPSQITGDSLRRQVDRTRAWVKRNGYHLDESLTLRDLGSSGYYGDHLTGTGRLRYFLSSIESGRVKPGSSILVIESIDRLSREEVPKALIVFLGILQAGVRIFELDEEELFDSSTLDEISLIGALLRMSRAHGESKRKSRLGRESWDEKRRNLDKVKLTAKCPGWLRLNEDKTAFLEVPEKVAIVRRIFELAATGHGVAKIVKTFNREKVPCLGWGGAWSKVSVLRILNGRGVLGEYQPHTGRAGRRQPLGDPIPDYYPAIITEDLWFRVQRALKERRQLTGPNSKRVANLFTGLIHDGSGTVVTNRKDHRWRLVSYGATRGQGNYLSFPYDVFEAGFLAAVQELRAEDLTGSTSGNDLASIEGRIADLDSRIRKIKSRIKTDPDLDSLIEVLRDLEVERKDLQSELARAKQEAAVAFDTLSPVQALKVPPIYSEDPEAYEIRTRAKGLIHELVSRIRVVFSRDGGGGKFEDRTCTAEITFRSGVLRSLVIRTDYRNGGIDVAFTDVGASAIDSIEAAIRAGNLKPGPLT